MFSPMASPQSPPPPLPRHDFFDHSPAALHYQASETPTVHNSDCSMGIDWPGSSNTACADDNQNAPPPPPPHGQISRASPTVERAKTISFATGQNSYRSQKDGLLVLRNEAQAAMLTTANTPDNHTRMTRPFLKPISTQREIDSAAFLSFAAQEFLHRIPLREYTINGIEYKQAFDGQVAVTTLMQIAKVKQRDIALRLGRALEAQRFFHQVHYEFWLIDSPDEVYQLNEPYYTVPSTSDDSSYAPASAGTMTTASSATSVSSETPEGESPFGFFRSSGPMSGAAQPLLSPEINEPQDIPRGVFTELTRCYSVFCPDKQKCYSFTCPNRRNQANKRTRAMENVNETAEQSPARQRAQQTWSEMVPRHICDSLSQAERKQQEAMYELVSTEERYVQSLDYIFEMWIKPLRKRPIIEASRRERFIQDAFANILEIRKVNTWFLHALHMRQRENVVINHIGDIVLDLSLKLEPYISYGANQPKLKHVLDCERYNNPQFKAFAEAAERHVLASRVEIYGHLHKPVQRLGQYTLLLTNILKHSVSNDDNHSQVDRDALTKATSIVRDYHSRTNIAAAQTEITLKLEQVHAHLRFKNKDDEMDLKLLHPSRTILKECLFRKNGNTRSTWYTVILFDHYLVVAKVKMIRRVPHYTLQRRPIPIELLKVSVPDPRPRLSQSMSLSRHTSNVTERIRPTRDSDALAARMSTDTTITILEPNTAVYPVLFENVGRRGAGSCFTLFAQNADIRQLWIKGVLEQQELRKKRYPVFEAVPIVSDKQFSEYNKIQHICTFDRGQRYVLAADNGIYVGDIKKHSLPRKIISVRWATQVRVIEDAHLLLVLAARTLWQYNLDVLNTGPENQPAAQRIKTDVPFFHVGKCVDRTLICVPKVSRTRTHITLYEPSRSQEKRQRLLSKLVRLSVSDTNLKVFKLCYVPSEIWAIDLTSTKILVSTRGGMVMIDLPSNMENTRNILDHSDPKLEFITKREADLASLPLFQDSKHIAVFSTGGGLYLVCYDEYAFYINGLGRRMRPDFLIEWEGNPESYMFQYPYVVAFSRSFVEIRHSETGLLEQIILGDDIRYFENSCQKESPLVFGSMQHLQQHIAFMLTRTDHLHIPSA